MSNFKNIFNWLTKVRQDLWISKTINYKAIKWDVREPWHINVQIDGINISNIDNTITNKKWERIVVYLKDMQKKYFKWKIEKLPKIHFYNCSTIKERQENNTFESRYIWVYTITWKLNVELFDNSWENENIYEELLVCKNCKEDAKKDWLIDNELLSPFSLKKYFDFYEYFRNRVTSPKYDFITITKNQYPKNWEEISKIEREKVKYICQKCGWNALSNKNFLDVHHIDQNKWNNFTDNFLVVCKICHSNLPDHWHYKKELIENWIYDRIKNIQKKI